MKKRLNILCLLVMLVLSYSVFEQLYYIVQTAAPAFEAGFEAGVEGRDVKAESERLGNMQPVALMPSSLPAFPDSVLNAKTGEYVPAIYAQMIVSVKTNPSFWQKLILKIMAFANIFATVFAIYIFFRVIISINKSVIFDWKNVRRLRWVGGSLILAFICSLTTIAITSCNLSDVFALEGYAFSFSELVSITSLLLGLSALIVGEVFAIGLRMKEEQELTI